MSTLASSQQSCQSALPVSKEEFIDRRRHNQSTNLLSRGVVQPPLILETSQSAALPSEETANEKRTRLQSAKPQSRGLVLSESHNYVSKNASHFYNSKKRAANQESNYEYSMPDYFRLLDHPGKSNTHSLIQKTISSE